VEEEWRVIEDFPDYAVSNMGRVKRITKTTNTFVGKILKPRLGTARYFQVNLCKDGKARNMFIHRLVLMAFVGPCPINYGANHKNGIRTDNELNNLEWTTAKQNSEHAIKTGLWHSNCGENNPNSFLKKREVWLIKKLLANKIKQKSIGKMFGVNPVTISDIKRGLTWKHIEI